MKENVWKRFLVTSVALAMAVLLVPQVQAFGDEVDTNGWVSWLPVVEKDGGFYPPMQAEPGAESKVAISFVNDPVHSSDQNGAIKAERKVAGGIQLRLDKENNIGAAILPKRENEVVMIASARVWADEDAAGSTLASYAFFENGNHFNSAYSNAEVRTLEYGWQTVYFDITQCKYLGFLFWQSTSASGVIYLDDLKLKYVGVNDPIDSFDHFTDDWSTAQSKKCAITQNTDLQYIKEGTGSIRIDCTTAGDQEYILKSKLLGVPNADGRLLPRFEGYTAKNYGFWVYNVDADVTISGAGGSNRSFRINQPGWHYISWDFGSSTSSWQNNEERLRQFAMTSKKAGTIYIDALSVEYEKDDEIIAERFNSNSIWFHPSYSDAFSCYDHHSLQENGNGAYVKEGFTSGRLTIKTGKATYPHNEVPTQAWRDGGMATPADKHGNRPAKLGMWVYGNGNSGVQLGIETRIDNANSEVTDPPISVDWEGWKQIWFELPEGTTSIYGIRYANISEQDAVVYIDKMTFEYPEVVAEPVNALMNGDEELDLATVKQNDTIGYQVDLVKDDAAGNNIWIMAAAYDASGKLLKVQMERVQSDTVGKIKGEARITVDTAELLQAMASVKGICWKAGSLTPVCTAAAAK